MVGIRRYTSVHPDSITEKALLGHTCSLFPAPILDGLSVTEPAEDSAGDSQLSKYLEWLEEKDHQHESNAGTISNEGSMDDIDKLADRFITKCHQKFILEKEESYWRFQEMIAI